MTLHSTTECLEAENSKLRLPISSEWETDLVLPSPFYTHSASVRKLPCHTTTGGSRGGNETNPLSAAETTLPRRSMRVSEEGGLVQGAGWLGLQSKRWSRRRRKLVAEMKIPEEAVPSKVSRLKKKKHKYYTRHRFISFNNRGFCGSTAGKFSFSQLDLL